MKKTEKGSCVVVWERGDYLSEAEKQLCDQAICKDVLFNEKILSDLVAGSYKLFRGLQRKRVISEKDIKYFLHNYKNATNLGKLYFYPKFTKGFSTYLEDPLYLTVAVTLKRHPNSQIIIWNQLCIVVSHTSRI